MRAAFDLVYGLLATANTWTANNAFNSTATSGSALSVTRNLTATSTDAPVVAILQDHASDDQPALRVGQDGTGTILDLQVAAATVLSVATTGNLATDGAVTAAAGFRSGGNSMADDTAVDIVTTLQGILFVYAASNVNTNSRYLMAAFRASTTPICQGIVMGSEVTTSTSAVLTGTVGTDAKLNVSVVNGHVYIENRLGATITVAYTILR